MSQIGPNIDRKLQNRGRRGFIKLLLSVGVTLPAAIGLSQESLAEMDISLQKEIPYVARKVHKNEHPIEPGEKIEYEKEYETVPRTRWEKIESALAATRKLNNQINNKFSNTKGQITPKVTAVSEGEIALVVDYEKHHQPEETNKKHQGAGEGQNIEYKWETPGPSFQRVQRELPGRIEANVPPERVDAFELDGTTKKTYSFPISFEISKKSKLSNICQKYWYNDVYSNEVPAGCKIEQGTAGPPAVDSNTYEQKLLSAGHTYANNDNGVVRQPGGNLFPIDPNKIAKVEKVVNEGKRDYGKAGRHDISNPPTYKWNLADNSGGFKDKPIRGIISWQTIKNNIGNNDFDLKKQGARTGTTDGHLEKIVDNSISDVFDMSMWAGKGDSGGPIFEEREYGIYVAGIVIGAEGISCPYDTTTGISIEYVQNKLEVHV